MPGQTFIFQSGAQDDAAGFAFPVVPQAPMTFTKDLDILGGAFTAISTNPGSSVETATTRHIWTCDAPSAIIAVYERHSVIGSTTGMLVTAKGSTPLNSGINTLASTMDQTGTVDVLRTGTLQASTTLTQLSIGDALGWRYTTPGNLAPTGQVTVVLQRF